MRVRRQWTGAAHRFGLVKYVPHIVAIYHYVSDHWCGNCATASAPPGKRGVGFGNWVYYLEDRP